MRKQVQNVELVVLTILGCVLWNLIAFFTFAKRMFPNFWCAHRLPCISLALDPPRGT
jgi:Na+/glutamate symporter